MRVVMVAVGSRGDVQPYVALAQGLQAAGHRVRLATHAVFEDLVHERDLDFAALTLDPRAFLRTLAQQAGLETAGSPTRFVPFFRACVRLYGSRVLEALDECWKATQDAEAIVFSPLALGALDIAEKLGVAAYVGAVWPLWRHRPALLFPQPALGPLLTPVYNRLTYVLGQVAQGMTRALAQGIASPLQAMVNRWRVDALGLPPRSTAEFLRARDRIPTLYGMSPTVFPPPPDWPSFVHVTGYWFLESTVSEQPPPPELLAFLAAGPAPVYVGFGSMMGRDPIATSGIVVEALARSRQRGVLLTGWGGLDRTAIMSAARARGVEVVTVDSISHDWLFPRMAAVFHHAGAGTAAASLRAGVPSGAVPFFGDQLYWGAALSRLGAGPPPVSQRRLTAARLAEAITRAVTDPSIRARAAVVGARIRAEDGVKTAVAMFHRHLAA